MAMRGKRERKAKEYTDCPEIGRFINGYKGKNDILQQDFELKYIWGNGMIIGFHKKDGAFDADPDHYDAYRLIGDHREQKMIKSVGLFPIEWEVKYWTGWGIDGWIAYIERKDKIPTSAFFHMECLKMRSNISPDPAVQKSVLKGKS